MQILLSPAGYVRAAEAQIADLVRPPVGVIP